MLNIIICDDNKSFLKMMARKTSDFLQSQNISCHIISLSSVEKLLKTNINQIDIIFLDVHFKTISGIEAAKILRRISQKFILVFISDFIEYAPSGYEVNAFRYILKEQINILFKDAMNEIIKQLGYFRSEVSFKFIGGERTVYTDNIVYIESHLHEVHFHFSGSINDTSYFYDTLKSVHSQLPHEEFIRIHQSYLVNVRYFLDAKNYRALLTGNIELPISQKLFPTVKKQLFLYRGRIS